MKTSFVSSTAISQALRYQMLRMQSELTQRQQEATTGTVADAGVALGSGVARTVSLDRDIQRLQGMIDSNGIASNRLSATQDALTQITKIGQTFLSTLTGSVSGVDNIGVMQSQSRAALDTLTGLLNTNLNGEYLFAGINTDVKPINDFSDPASPNKVAFDQAFSDFFGFTQTDPQAANISSADMTAFLQTKVEPLFNGSSWQDWSNATDETITSRISLNDTTQTSLSANTDGAKKLLMASATISGLLDGPLGKDAQGVVYNWAVNLVGGGLAAVASDSGAVGVTQNRVSDASDKLSAQVDLSKTFLQNLEGVDPYEAATRVNELLTQIDTSYSLTARIQQLSLVNYLP